MAVVPPSMAQSQSLQNPRTAIAPELLMVGIKFLFESPKNYAPPPAAAGEGDRREKNGCANRFSPSNSLWKMSK